jgi:hypothetical protein
LDGCAKRTVGRALGRWNAPLVVFSAAFFCARKKMSFTAKKLSTICHNFAGNIDYMKNI